MTRRATFEAGCRAVSNDSLGADQDAEQMSSR
jgi:hypothetical protein